MRRVEVCPYDKEWAQMFREEAEKINLILGDEMIHIYHIGSTSIPGLSAKPIIDIMPVVIDIYKVDTFNRQMEELGYIAKGENGISGRRYFQKGGDHRSHHIHIYQNGSHEIERHLALRDYLITHPIDMKNYGELKEKLARQFPEDIESYIKGKDLFVKKMEQKALKWYENNQNHSQGQQV
ncbi:GrpB family protein [Peribacillus sp. SCS-37]|uniref:GrpB family protein n=1 Tax=Paraperibacillus esterisolvens TaxID=3115296 RepID=UPI003906280C